MKEYFSHEYNARDDKKMPKLLAEVGYEGYGIFWAVVEMLYKNEGFMQLDCKSIAFALHCDCICLDRVLNEFDLFIIEDGKFYSESVLKRLGIRKEISDKRRTAAMSRDYTSVKQKQSKSIAKGPKIKEKESKVNYIYSEFYDSEIEKSKGHNLESNYLMLVKFLFGINGDRKLESVLKLKNQLSFNDFIKLMDAIKTNGKSIKVTLIDMENYEPLTKHSSTVYFTILKYWKREVAK